MPTWEALETLVRPRIQGTLQELWGGAAAASFLGRAPSVRRAVVDGSSGYRNGCEAPRRVVFAKASRRPHPKVVEILSQDRERMMTFCDPRKER
jgi:hypothetical protein